ncbi:MAG TPA: hypothetical protein VE197_00850 [Mycobacterium sp.]|nr:hypothetical protein [Mycobacterium sp.]
MARLPDRALAAITELLAAGARVLRPFGVSLPPVRSLLAIPNTHILGQTYHSAAPLRYGQYVAKIRLRPLSMSVRQLPGQPLPRDAGFDAHRKLVVDFFRSDSAEYELQAQLCSDPAAMPIEDATVAWSEVASPPCGVAKITFPIQDAGNIYRRVYADDVLSFNSWRALEAHRPLGSINRLKTAASALRSPTWRLPALWPCRPR